MKRLKKIALIVAVLLMFPVAASAWEINIVNKTDRQIQIWVRYMYGFFQTGAACWNETIEKGNSLVCGIPSPNCATDMTWTHHGCGPDHTDQVIGIGFSTWFPTCWNVKLTISEDLNGNITYDREKY